jgi:hypothetical protein
MKKTLCGLTILAAMTFCLSAQTVLFEEQFDGTIGYNPDSATAVGGDNDWVDFSNRLTNPFSGSEGYATAVGGSETVLTGEPTHNDPQIRSDFNVGLNKLLVGQAVMRIRADMNDDGIYNASDALTAADVSAFYTLAPFTSPGATSLAGSGVSPVSFGTPTITTEANGWHVFTWPDLGGIITGTGSTVGGLRLDPLNNKIGISYEIDYFRINQTANPPPVIEVDPGSPVGGEFTLRQEWHWSTDGELDGWTANNFDVTTPPNGVAGSIVTGASTTGDAQFISPSFTVADVESGRFVMEIGVISSPGDTTPKQLFYALSGGAFFGSQSITMPAAPGDNNAHVYRITFDDDINAPITRLRFDPSSASGVTTKIDYIRIYSEGPEITPPLAELDPAALGAEWSLADEWTWNTDDDLEGWTPTNFDVPVPNNGTLGVLGGKLVGQALTGDPQLASPTLSITEPASKRVAVEIDFAADPGTTVGGTLFWSVDGSAFSSANSITLPVVPSNGAPHTVRVTFDGHLGGTLTGLRIDPANENNVTVGLDAVRIFREAPADDYDIWSAAQSWTPGAPNTGATEDFDGDGITNDAERLFGLVPTSPSSITPITATLATNGKFTYQRRDPALSQGTYRVFTSTNLQVWTEDTGISENITPGEIQSVEVTLSATPVNGRLFVRVAAD